MAFNESALVYENKLETPEDMNCGHWSGKYPFQHLDHQNHDIQDREEQ